CGHPRRAALGRVHRGRHPACPDGLRAPAATHCARPRACPTLHLGEVRGADAAGPGADRAPRMSIQFAILLEAAPLQRWQLKCLQRLLALPDVHATCVIRLASAAGELSRSLRTARGVAEAGAPDDEMPLPVEIAALPGIRLEEGAALP